MAPEQARGSTAVDARVDVYAVGAVLYHMLTGKPPFADEEPAMTLTKVLTEDPRRPRDLERSIPEGVEALIQRAMAREPAGRPATVQDLDRLLAAFDAAGAEGTTSPVAVARADGAAVATAATLAVPAHPSEAEEATRRARRARPAALVRAIAFSVFAGAAVLVASASTLRVVTSRATFSEKEIALVGAFSLATTLFLFLSAVRVLIGRWRSAPAIERLGAGLRAARLWLIVPLGTLTLGARGVALFGPALPQEVASAVEIGLLDVPVLLGLGVFAVTLWRARRS
jgi:serine/threonine-protein kinase